MVYTHHSFFHMLDLVERQSVGSISNLEAAPSGPNQLRVTWNRVPGATGYKVTWRLREGEF